MDIVRVKSKLVVSTNIRIIAVGLDGKIRDVTEFHNLIMTVGKNMFRDALYGAVTDLKIKYLAYGSDSTAVAVGHTTLFAEEGRKAIISYTPGATGILVSTTYIAPYEANTPPDIEELGWFAGVDAEDTIDTGIMISRVLYNRGKTELESLQIERTDTISEV